MMVGDSFYLDMLFAERLGFYKVMVDAVKGGHRIKTLANSIVQTSIYSVLPRDEFTYGKYYHGKRGISIIYKTSKFSFRCFYIV